MIRTSDYKARAVERLSEQLGQQPVTNWSQLEGLEKLEKSDKIHKLVSKSTLPKDAHVAQLVEQRFRKP